MNCLIPFRHRAAGSASPLLARRPNDLFDRVLGDFFGDAFLAAPARADGATWTPALDLDEDETSYTVRVELPGLDSKEVAVEFHDGVLSISGQKEEQRSDKEHGASWRERRWGSFKRVVELPSAVVDDSVKATFEKGVLTVALQKAKPSGGRKIAVEAR
jgi:HSP20 family protein